MKNSSRFCFCGLVAVQIVFSALGLAAQTNPSAWTPEALKQMEHIQQSAFQSDYAYRQLAHLTDNIGPRMIGSPQAAGAVEYVAQELRRLGLEVRQEKVMVPHWVRGEERAELVSYPGQVPGTQQKIVVTALATINGATPPEGITADVLVVANFDELAALPREKVQGKIVVFNYPFDGNMAASGFALDAYGGAVAYRGGGRTAGARQGAAAVLARSAGGADFRLPHTGVTGYDRKLPAIPVASITAEDAELLARLTAQGPVRMHLVLTPKQLPDVESYNVIADLKGSLHPEQVVIVSGHLDSWDLGTGALDDGAGVAVAMATAQLMKQLDLQPERTIRVVAWMAEELGGIGGDAYATQHKPEISNHVAAIETDLGAGRALGINLCCDEKMLPLFQPVAKALQFSNAGILRVAEETGVDIDPLKTAGVPTFSPIQDLRKYFDYHHSPADTLDKVDRRELQDNVAVVSTLTFALATMQGELPRKSH